MCLDSANHDHKSGQPIPEAKIFKDDELVNMIDPILDSDDRNYNASYIFRCASISLTDLFPHILRQSLLQ